jgi:hypothetical protein
MGVGLLRRPQKIHESVELFGTLSGECNDLSMGAFDSPTHTGSYLPWSILRGLDERDSSGEGWSYRIEHLRDDRAPSAALQGG